MVSPWSGPHRPAERGPDPWGCLQFRGWTRLCGARSWDGGCPWGQGLKGPQGAPVAFPCCCWGLSLPQVNCASESPGQAPAAAHNCSKPVMSPPCPWPPRVPLGSLSPTVSAVSCPGRAPATPPSGLSNRADPLAAGSASEASCPSSCPPPLHPRAAGVPARLPRRLLLSVSQLGVPGRVTAQVTEECACSSQSGLGPRPQAGSWRASSIY